MARVLLIDADVVAYEAAASKEKAIEYEPGYWTWHVSFEEVTAAVDERISSIVEKLEADDYKLCLTDSEGNFRFGVLPSYKGNRTTKKPLCWFSRGTEPVFPPRSEPPLSMVF